MSNEPGLKATVVPLNSSRDIYLVIDARNQPAGTGTKEVCEFLAELIERPYNPKQFEGPRGPVKASMNVRSAIQI